MNMLEESRNDLTEIRLMMDRSSKFLSLSGLGGISAGIVALIGSAIAYYQIRSNETSAQPKNLTDLFFLDACVMLVLAIGLAMAFSIRMAKKKGLPVWNHTTKYLIGSLMVPLATGGIFSIILWYHGLVIFIAPSTLVFYGLALINSSKFTVNEIRYLAFGEIVLGLLAAMLLEQWLLLWAIGFGVLHIVYGIFLYMKYEHEKNRPTT